MSGTDDLTVIVLTNLAGADPAGIARGVARLSRPEFSAAAAPVIDDPEPEATARIRAAVEHLLTGEVDRPAFTPDFAKFLDSRAARDMTRSAAKAASF